MSAAVSLSRSPRGRSLVRNAAETRDAVAATVRGEIPAWLRGELVRTCPAVFETSSWRAEHWFDGLGMIYAFEIGDASIEFRSRLLECDTARGAASGKAKLGSFGTPAKRPVWSRIFQPIIGMPDNANVNIVKMGDELVAMTESSRQVAIDERTLASRGDVAYANDGLSSAMMSAHPHFDFGRGRVVNVATKFGPNTTIGLYEHAPNARRREVIASWRPKRVPYVHAFGLTDANAILVAHPFSVNSMKLLWSNKGYIDHFDWTPSEGTRLVVMDRATGATREHVADPFFVFHTVNAFERGDATVLDLLAYPNADIVNALRIDRLNEQLPDLRPSLVRIAMRPGQERATVEKVSDCGFEFPSIHYKRVNGHAYRYVWGASVRPEAGEYASNVVKVDVETGAFKAFADGKYLFGEPVFVARPGAADEDDGVLVTVGGSDAAETSLLAVLDAKTMALVASAEVPTAIPLGFHGSFVRR